MGLRRTRGHRWADCTTRVRSSTSLSWASPPAPPRTPDGRAASGGGGHCAEDAPECGICRLQLGTPREGESGLATIGFGRTSAPTARFDMAGQNDEVRFRARPVRDLVIRLRYVECCRCTRCSSKSELCEANSNSGPSLRPPPPFGRLAHFSDLPDGPATKLPRPARYVPKPRCGDWALWASWGVA